jgi:hypothetical protein
LYNISLSINLESLEMNSSGNITGEVYFISQDIEYLNDPFLFPEENWNDFVVIILGWWIKNLIRVIQEKPGSTVDFDFMDGPFLVKSKKVTEDTLELKFLENTSSDCIIINICNCSLNQIAKSILKSAKRILKVSKEKNWDIDDVNELEKLTSLLGKSMSGHK